MKQREERKKISRQERLRQYGRIGKWFQTICFLHVPVVGFIYMLVQALGKRTPPARKDFAKAYLLYRILVLFLACMILYTFYRMGLDLVDQLLDLVKV